MSIRKRVILFLCVAVVFASSIAFSQDIIPFEYNKDFSVFAQALPHPQMDADVDIQPDILPGICEKLNLNEEQKKKLDEVRLKTQKENIKLRADLQVKRLELKELIESEKTNQDEIDKKIQEIEKIRTQLLKNKVNTMLEVKKILTPEQREKLKTLRPDVKCMKERRPKKFKDKMKKMKDR